MGGLYESNQDTVSTLNRRQFQQPDLLSIIDGWHTYQRHSQLLKIKNVLTVNIQAITFDKLDDEDVYVHRSLL